MKMRHHQSFAELGYDDHQTHLAQIKAISSFEIDTKMFYHCEFSVA